jgi:flagellar motor switch protein FliG
MILEERELLGSVPLSDVVEAQKQILTTVREMIDNGEVNVAKGRGAAYVS